MDIEKKERVKMSKTNEGNPRGNIHLVGENENNDTGSQKDNNILRRAFHNPDKVWNIINGSLAAGIILAIIGGAFSLYSMNEKLNNAATKGEIDAINTKMDLYNEKFENEYINLENTFEDFKDKFDDLKLQVNIMQATHNTYKCLATDSFQKDVVDLCRKDDINSVSNSLWNDDDIIAINGEEKFTSNELADQKLFFSYMQGNQEVYFFGQYSENKRWDGDCIINVYENNKLLIITEASYADGQLISYQQAYSFATKAGNEVWCISEREHTKDGNNGNSWNYFKEEDILKEFTLEDSGPENILTVGQIREGLSGNLEGFYHGITSNGRYNDDTGEAYLVKFSLDGTVRTLYKGKFLDGEFNDTSDEAESWIIGRQEEIVGSRYAYFKGNFENGNQKDNDKSEKKSDLEYEDILEKTNPYFFKCKLLWYGFENDSF